ncbi:hypothetical protein N7447_004977, partial [Penicillium robsamsonii]|uniref:uncharacterized protein n=1 Tax=Penicillium robsamsonii TaxID=1792511 RepID=UPI00254819BF
GLGQVVTLILKTRHSLSESQTKLVGTRASSRASPLILLMGEPKRWPGYFIALVQGTGLKPGNLLFVSGGRWRCSQTLLLRCLRLLYQGMRCASCGI